MQSSNEFVDRKEMDIDDGCALIELKYKSNAEGSKEVRAKVLSKFHQVSSGTVT